MKRPVLIILVFTAILMIAISGCSEKKKDKVTNPPEPFDIDSYTNIDWVIYLYGRDMLDKGSNPLSIHWKDPAGVDTTTFVVPYQFTFYIDGEPLLLFHPQIGFGDYEYNGSLELDGGSTHQFKLVINNVTKLDKSVRICYNHLDSES